MLNYAIGKSFIHACLDGSIARDAVSAIHVLDGFCFIATLSLQLIANDHELNIPRSCTRYMLSGPGPPPPPAPHDPPVQRRLRHPALLLRGLGGAALPRPTPHGTQPLLRAESGNLRSSFPHQT